MTDATESLKQQAERLAEAILAGARAQESKRDLRQRLEALADRGKTTETSDVACGDADSTVSINDLLTMLQARPPSSSDDGCNHEAETDEHDADRKAEDTDDAKAASRRKLMMGLAGVVGAAGLLSGGAKEAKAQFGGGGDVVDGLEDLVEIMIEFFEMLPAMLIPTEWLALLNQLLAMLDAAGADSFSRLETIPTALERSFPEDPPRTPAEQNDLVIERARASRARVTAAMQRNAAVNEQQGMMSMQEQANLIAGQAAGSSGYGVIGLFQAMFSNQTLLNQRIGYLSLQLSTTNELLAELVVRQSNPEKDAVVTSDRFFSGSTEDVAPIRTAPGG
ncbi:hypothetical protein [Marinivivus vitaminiproducens]|uniref:hypothetical protein n=1 Tax=Marinivivus vitaminiproducens TaxID=3035935 RepID=UPI0027A1DD4B|nr:hypothetical protein P4R82_24590 [Geminicoccaceae bacterium SCSIO 64248]